MITCPKCKFEHPHDVRICTRCGSLDPATLIIDNHTFKLEIEESQALSGNPSKNSDVVLPNDLLSIKINEERLVFPIDKRIVLGRGMRTGGSYHAVDLTHFGGQQAGVSRCHADIQRNGTSEVVLTDLGSTNGTFLNGKRLLAFQAVSLHSSCEIYLSKLRLVITFEAAASSTKQA